MKRLPLVLLFGAVPAFAQITVTPEGPSHSATAQAQENANRNLVAAVREKPTPETIRRAEAVEPAPEATPKRKRGLFNRLLHRGHSGKAEKAESAAPPAPAASPEPSAPPASSKPAHRSTRTPAIKPAAPEKAATETAAHPSPTPKASRKHASKNAEAEADRKPEAEKAEAVSEPKAGKPKATPTPAVAEATPAPTPKGSNKRGRKTQAAAPSPSPAPETSAAAKEPESTPAKLVEFDKPRYLEVKQKAAHDSKVAALGAKLASTPHEGKEYKTAASRYSKALFSKMRELDSSQTEWVDRMEAATQRRIDAGKPIVVE